MVTRIGVLASQGAFVEHINALSRLKADAVPVRLPAEIAGIDGLIIPGGESTTMCSLMLDYQITGEIKRLAGTGLPVLGTCAGLVLLSRKLANGRPEPLGLMDISVRRNAFGRQRESFETDLDIPALGDKPYHAVFIRAPVVEAAGEGVEILARLDSGSIVAARQGGMVATAFHPELTDDLRFHRYFLDIVAGKNDRG
ncbi:MAG: pyridoxal 5'-phosphate synthase glutaminase subunit PdxT [Chloroflexi bacterium]|nr:pyridoxal 5'-phosphate synthase glutaminase subunit PdxT [Chloroflexota bacterium]